jgi:hypothetical protein
MGCVWLVCAVPTGTMAEAFGWVVFSFDVFTYRYALFSVDEEWA